MQFTTISLGLAIAIFVVYTSYMTITNPIGLPKLNFMRNKLGIKLGTSIHTVVYMVIPGIFAYFMIKAGINGETISQFITE